MRAADLLLSDADVSSALGPDFHLRAAAGPETSQPLGDVLRAAAADSAYARYSGTTSAGDEEQPVAVGLLALVFDSPDIAARTFDQVAQAAHLRTEIDGCDVTVETVSGAGGLVSYWGFVRKGPAILVVTMDTLDPQVVSMTQFRAVAIRTAEHLNREIDG